MEHPIAIDLEGRTKIVCDIGSSGSFDIEGLVKSVGHAQGLSTFDVLLKLPNSHPGT